MTSPFTWSMTVVSYGKLQLSKPIMSTPSAVSLMRSMPRATSRWRGPMSYV
ncbi:MAG: hypothetical protein IPK07_10655 [Deltaproteobacteria bacterium]|nr:hypothetical protein [Deltaproteobacteria bacterium]